MKGTILSMSVAIAVSAIGCGSGEESAAGDAMRDVSKAAGEMVDDTAGMAREAADDAAAQAKGAAEAAGGAYTAAAESMSDVASATGDAVARCLELAAAMKWGEALTPCTEAAKQKPNDLRIKHAVQQAQAAADAG